MRTRISFGKLTLLACLISAAAAPASGQSDPINLRVNKLEKEMKAVQRKVFPGGTPVEPELGATPAPAVPAGSPTAAPIADLTSRVDALESQLKSLTGQVEQDGFRLKKLEDAVKALQDAAAAPARAGEILGLDALASGIADVSGARTRFVLVGNPTAPPAPTGNDRTSVVFGVRHEPNSLVQALTELSIRGINLSRIESRPTRVDRFTYFFHIDLVGHIDDPMVAEALAALHHRTSRLRFLGSWPVDGHGDAEAPPADRAADRAA